jgi:hypothetical protein
MSPLKAAEAHLDSLPSHNQKLLRPLHQKPRELVTQYLLDLVGLFDFDRHTNGVNGRLYQTRLVFAS